LYFWFEYCIIFGWGVIWIFSTEECVDEGAHGLNHQAFRVVSVPLLPHVDTEGLLPEYHQQIVPKYIPCESEECAEFVCQMLIIDL